MAILRWGFAGALAALAWGCAAAEPAAKPETEAGPGAETGPGAAPDWAARLKDLDAEYARAEEEFYRPWREAKTAEEQAKLGAFDMTKSPAPAYLSRYLEIARGAKGTAEGLAACSWILGRAPGGDAGTAAAAEAADLMAKDGIDCPALARLTLGLRYAAWRLGEDPVAAALQAIAEKSAVDDNRGAALFSLAALRNESATATAEQKAEARRMLGVVLEEYPGSPFAAMAAGTINEIERLQVGMTAPDFEATDGDGVKFRLSDYRGRVVVLDFWGFW